MSNDVRWKQRFANFERAVDLLHEPLARDVSTLSALENEGTVQRFEFTLELAWKTLKDYLEHEGRVVTPVTARNVLEGGVRSGNPDGGAGLDRHDRSPQPAFTLV